MQSWNDTHNRGDETCDSTRRRSFRHGREVRLVEDDKNQGTYGEVYEANCARYGRDPDIPMELFKAALNPAVLGQVTGSEAVLDLRLKAFMDIASQHVTENIFSQYMYKTLPNGAHLWTFKRQLCQQLALSSFVSALLRIGGRTPRKISFAKNTGKVFMLDFYPSFDSNGLIEDAEPVPFRLTRNLHAFSRHSASKATSWPLWQPLRKHALAPGRNVRMHLDVYFRDSLTIWPRATATAGSTTKRRHNDAKPLKTSAAAAAFSPNPMRPPSTKWPKQTLKKP